MRVETSGSFLFFVSITYVSSPWLDWPRLLVFEKTKPTATTIKNALFLADISNLLALHFAQQIAVLSGSEFVGVHRVVQDCQQFKTHAGLKNRTTFVCEHGVQSCKQAIQSHDVLDLCMPYSRLWLTPFNCSSFDKSIPPCVKFSGFVFLAIPSLTGKSLNWIKSWINLMAYFSWKKWKPMLFWVQQYSETFFFMQEGFCTGRINKMSMHFFIQRLQWK